MITAGINYVSERDELHPAPAITPRRVLPPSLCAALQAEHEAWAAVNRIADRLADFTGELYGEEYLALHREAVATYEHAEKCTAKLRDLQDAYHRGELTE
jgi:hypothetical protein